MIHIDGSRGEGGGQIIRTAVALSSLTGKSVEITNIRANRPNPGLRPQHLNAIKAIADLCGAEVDGLVTGSGKITFAPNELSGGKIEIDVGTAGSVTLVAQALMVSCVNSKEKFEFKITGGTDVRWSPPLDYLRFVTLPLLKKFNYDAEIDLVKRGYYPKGGGEIRLVIEPSTMRPIDLVDRGNLKEITGISHAHSGLKEREVCERQARSARKLLLDQDVKIEMEYAETPSYGSGITLIGKFDNSAIGSSSLGEKGKSSEQVGEEAAEKLLRELNSDSPIDRHTGDQIVPYIAIAGGMAKAPEITGHLETNVWVANEFGYGIRIDKNVICGER